MVVKCRNTSIALLTMLRPNRHLHIAYITVSFFHVIFMFWFYYVIRHFLNLDLILWLSLLHTNIAFFCMCFLH